MTLAIKSLADGQLTTTKTALYTAPTTTITQAIVDNITLTHTTEGDVTIKLYFLESGGTSRRIYRAELGDEEQAIMIYKKTLEAGDAIEGEASSGGVVDYVISGAENA